MKTKNKNAFGLPSVSSTAPVVAQSKAQQMAERKAIIAESADPVIRKTIAIALDDDHPGQMSALKMLNDRLMPISEFESLKGGARTSVTISITGVGESPIVEGKSSDIEEV